MSVRLEAINFGRYTCVSREIVHPYTNMDFTRGYISGRVPQVNNGFYDVQYFTGEKAEKGVQFPKDGAFLDPESHYKHKSIDQIKWIRSRVPEGNVLDVGTGPGHLAYWARKTRSPITIVGCDISLPLLKSKFNQNKERTAISTGNNLPFRDNSFKAVVFSDVLEHMWPNEAIQAVKDAHRVLFDGGYVFVKIPNRDSWDSSPHRKDQGHVWLPNINETTELFIRCGFEREGIEVTTRNFPASSICQGFLKRDIRFPLFGRDILASAKKSS